MQIQNVKTPIKLKHPLPKPGDAGYFGAVRSFDIHTGIDLYCDDGDEVVAMEPGIVVEIEFFTGKDAGSPWWHDTWAILVEGSSGVIVYGEVTVNPGIEVGVAVTEGQSIGKVARVLKKDKCVNPTSMLHLELMEPGFYKTYWWRFGKEKPEGLLNPITLFDRID